MLIGSVAQLAEHRAFNLMAAGSNPARPSNKKTLHRFGLYPALKCW